MTLFESGPQKVTYFVSSCPPLPAIPSLTEILLIWWVNVNVLLYTYRILIYEFNSIRNLPWPCLCASHPQWFCVLRTHCYPGPHKNPGYVYNNITYIRWIFFCILLYTYRIHINNSNPPDLPHCYGKHSTGVCASYSRSFCDNGTHYCSPAFSYTNMNCEKVRQMSIFYVYNMRIHITALL